MTAALALDLGTTTGWAIRLDGALQSGFVSYKTGRYEGGGMRFLKFRKWLQDMRQDTGFAVVYFEEVRAHKGVDAAHIYGGMLATLTAFCEENSIPYEGIPVGTIKKFMTGKGNAKKEHMIAAVNNRGICVTDDNEADAISLLLCKEAT